MKKAVTVGRVAHTCISNEIELNYCYTLVNKSAVLLSSKKIAKSKITNNRIIKIIEDSFKKCA